MAFLLLDPITAAQFAFVAQRLSKEDQPIDKKEQAELAYRMNALIKQAWRIEKDLLLETGILVQEGSAIGPAPAKEGG